MFISRDGMVQRTLSEGINRYGRAESLGRGLSDSFREALDCQIPTLTAVRAPYAEAWSTFHGGYAQQLAFDGRAVTEWCREAAGQARAARRAAPANALRELA